MTAERCLIRVMQAHDLPLILQWRNHADIRRHMLTRHEITQDEHLAWFNRTSADESRRLLIVESASEAIGYVQFSNVTANGAADWGFYIAPGSGKGTGFKLGVAALDYAFGPLSLHKVCGQALAFNEASIAFHKKLGFVEEGRLREQHFCDGTYHALICFGLLRHEYANSLHRE